MDPQRITYFAETDARNKRIKFGIKAKDRLKHVYVIGKTGMGKSTLLENMAVQDIQGGNGMAVIDPHGSMAEKLLDYVPEERLKDVIYFAPFDTDYPIAFNLLEDIGENKRHLVVNGLMATFEKIWADAWSARMAYILSNTLYALLETPGSTLLGVNRMYSDKDFRKMIVNNIKNVSVKNFWTDEYAKYSEKFATEATAAIQNKVGQFTSNSLVRNIIGQSKSTFDIRQIMDAGKILIVNLSKGQVGDGNANLLGSMLITKIYLAALSRADADEATLNKLPNFYLYVDEFQSFANKSFANILSEARKYKLNLTIAHQYIEQMEEEVRDAVFGNVGTMITFRVGAFDAEVLEKEFAPVFTAEDLVNLGFAQVYLKLMIDGVSSQPFSARTLGPIQKPEVSQREKVIASSRAGYARTKIDVEKDITTFHLGEASSAPQPAQNAMRQQAQYGENRDNRGQHGGQYERTVNDGRNDREQYRQPERRDAPLQAPFQPRQEQKTSPTMSTFTKPPLVQAENTPVVQTPYPKNTSPEVTSQNQNKLAFMKVAEEMRMREQGQEKPLPRTPIEEDNLSKTIEIPPVMTPVVAPKPSETMSVAQPPLHTQNQSPLSLRDLKPEHEKVKIPTQENINSLKSALAGVLSKSPIIQAPPQPIQPKVPLVEKQEPARSMEEKNIPPVSPHSSGESVKPEVKVDAPISPTSESHSSIREIPEDILRNLLSMDEVVKT